MIALDKSCSTCVQVERVQLSIHHLNWLLALRCQQVLLKRERQNQDDFTYWFHVGMCQAPCALRIQISTIFCRLSIDFVDFFFVFIKAYRNEAIGKDCAGQRIHSVWPRLTFNSSNFEYELTFGATLPIGSTHKLSFIMKKRQSNESKRKNKIIFFLIFIECLNIILG